MLTIFFQATGHTSNLQKQSNLLTVYFQGPAGFRHERFLQLLLDVHTAEVLGKLLVNAKLKASASSALGKVSSRTKNTTT